MSCHRGHRAHMRKEQGTVRLEGFYRRQNWGQETCTSFGDFGEPQEVSELGVSSLIRAEVLGY